MAEQLVAGDLIRLRAAAWHVGRSAFPHQFNLRRDQAIGLVDEVAEGAPLQFQGFGGEGAGGFDGAGAGP